MASHLLSPTEAQQVITHRLSVQGDKAKKLVETVTEQGHVDRNKLEGLIGRTQQAVTTMSDEFIAADPDGTGFVSQKVAYDIISKFFPGFPESTRQAIIQNYDKHKNQMIDFNELKTFYIILFSKKDGLEARFEELDVDKSGFLEKEELKKTLMKELALWPMEANSLVDDCDKNKDGKIDKAEFLVMWANLFG